VFTKIIVVSCLNKYENNYMGFKSIMYTMIGFMMCLIFIRNIPSMCSYLKIVIKNVMYAPHTNIV